jgi:hypothetical protein
LLDRPSKVTGATCIMSDTAYSPCLRGDDAGNVVTIVGAANDNVIVRNRFDCR